MARQSAGLLMYRRREGALEVFLVHPGGPFWARKDLGVWSIPKGEFAPEENPLQAARREFAEETGFTADGEVVPLAPLKLSSRKVVHAWAVEGDVDAAALRSNTFTMEWPPGSGQQQQFPEVDRGEWYAIEAARQKISKGQAGLLEQLARIVPGAA